ncbi:2-oxoacid:acceptor oxidoreductase family protein [Geothrix sp. PMB-07]|uniref:2-oxoacid:acceptor oxidoreductase family protein n=1 Tax=Geothrix sp. PMB-07 TaxID=3068640 RepID=UPI00274160F2|nr:2-oxoacid:acceptor oxidoreductase family protein [Geothrix sp. PMB-07]WLT30253.1 2-oxoacid:acceptor oxidoreductase family protein [Geothrix sp. PMB-07]
MSKTSVIYDKFERHAQGQGLKGHATHYCPGCGHGLAHKFLAEAIDALGIQDRTVAVSPVGCSVFLYYYFDVGNTQAAHGRAPVVALGHKFANPESVVISYQGDGDLASIGLAETVATAQLGAPITVIFINNAIYGMTGGQMAPTTLMGQQSSTSPAGRDQYNGQPMKMAEMIAGLDGPVYVERVALFDAKQRIKAKKAIQKALKLQVEGRGYSFIEVLAECPTHLKMSPEETEKWVKECMEPIYPLGVKKDITVEPWFDRKAPCFKGEKILSLTGATTEHPERFCKGFPTQLDLNDVSLKLAGSGGDGAQTAAMLIARAAISEGFDATHIPSYGPESRGGTSYADVHVAETEVLNPGSPDPQILLAFNAPSLAKFGPTVRKGGYVIYDSSVVTEAPVLDPSIKVFPVPFTGIATDLGKAVVKNIVALGALQAATNIFPKETFLSAIGVALKDKCALIPLNEEAFAWGVKSVEALNN